MYKFTTITIAAMWLIALTSCNKNKSNFDASGSFEAEETIISSEAIGTIKQFDIEEGQVLKKGEFIGYIDTTQLYLKRNNWRVKLKLC